MSTFTFVIYTTTFACASGPNSNPRVGEAGCLGVLGFPALIDLDSAFMFLIDFLILDRICLDHYLMSCRAHRAQVESNGPFCEIGSSPAHLRLYIHTTTYLVILVYNH